MCFSQKYIPRIRLTVHMVTGYIVISQLLYSLIQSVLCKFHGRAVHKSLLLWYECTAVHCTGYSFVLELGLVRRRILRHMTDGQYSNFRIYCMQILKMHNLTQNYRINLAARGILQSHGTLRHMTE